MTKAETNLIEAVLRHFEGKPAPGAELYNALCAIKHERRPTNPEEVCISNLQRTRFEWHRTNMSDLDCLDKMCQHLDTYERSVLGH